MFVASVRDKVRPRIFRSTETVSISAGGAVTWNPSDIGSAILLSNGNLTAERNSGGDGYPNGGVRAGSYRAVGKRYFEVVMNQATTSPFIAIGVSTSSWLTSSTAALGADAYSWGYSQQTGNKRNNNSSTTYGASLTSGDVCGVAVDFSAGKIWFSKNGTWQASGDPVAGTNEAFANLAGTVVAPTAHLYRLTAPRHIVSAHFKTSDFTYAPPTGYIGWGD